MKGQRTLGYHANEEELDDKRNFKGCLIVLGLTYGEQH
jgi:hypothetical protein